MLSAIDGRQPGAGVRGRRQHVRGAGHQQHVVEGERLAQFHRASPGRSLGPSYSTPRRKRKARAGTPRASRAPAPLRGRVSRDALADRRRAPLGPPRKPVATRYFSELSLRLAGGLTCATLAKARFSRATSAGLGAAGQHLGDEGAARLQHVHGELRRRLAERHDAQVVGRRMARGGRRHVREHHVGLAAEPVAHRRVGALVEEVELRAARRPGSARPAAGRSPSTRPTGLPRLRAERVDPRHRHLGPAARRGAEVDHPRAGLQEAEPVVDLDELVGRAAAVALGPRPRHVGVVELALEPERRGELAALGGLDPHPQVAPAAPGARPPGPVAAALTPAARPSAKAPRGAHHREEHALAQAAVGDAHRLGRPDAAAASAGSPRPT